jgi:acetyltransferase-like isoleucine patch superfamily enzyme/acyl carrier protein
VEHVLKELKLNGRALQVSHAFHSPLMTSAAEKLKGVIAGLPMKAASIPVVTNVTGRVVTEEELRSGDHWAQHLVGTVRFADGMSTLRELGCEVFVEIGPEPTLIKMGRQCVAEARELVWVSSLDRRLAPSVTLAAAAEELRSKALVQPTGARLELRGYQLYKRQAFPWPLPTDVLSKLQPRQGQAADGAAALVVLTRAHVTEIITRCLKEVVQDVPEIRDETLLMDLQMDSLSAVSFVSDLSAELEKFGVTLPQHLLFSHPSVGDVITEVCTRSAARKEASNTDESKDGTRFPAAGKSTRRGLKEGTYSALEQDLDNLPAEKEQTRESWGILALYMLAMLYIGVILMLPGWAVLSTAFTYGQRYHPVVGIFIIAPLAKMSYTAILLMLVVVSKTLFLGNVKPHETIPLASSRYLQYWTITRLMTFANILVLGELKRTRMINFYYRLLGARIGSDVVIDTVGITDPDMVTIHDGTVVCNGVLLLGHRIKEGMVHLDQIAVGRYCTLEPRAVLNAGSRIDHYCVVPALSGVGQNQMPSPVKSPVSEVAPEVQQRRARAALLETAGHVMGLYLTYAVAASSILCVDAVLSALTLTDAKSRGGIVSSLATLQITSGMYMPFMPLFVGGDIRGFEKTLRMVLLRYGLVGVAWIFPAFYVAYASVQISMTVMLKWALVGRWKPQLVADRSFLGYRKWLCDLLLEYSFRQSASLTLGTSFMNLWLTLLGAKVGVKACVRVCNGIHDIPDAYRDPDLVEIGPGAHVGDRAALVTGLSSATASEAGPQTLYGRIKVGRNGLVGMGSVLLPGAEIPAEAGLGALSRVGADDRLREAHMHMGNPQPKAIYRIAPEALVDRKFSPFEWILYLLFPLLQPVIISTTVAVAAFFTCYLTVMPLWHYLPNNAALVACPVIYILHGCLLCTLVILMKWVVLGELKASKEYRTYGLHYYLWNTVLVLMSIVHLHFAELLRGSPLFNLYLGLLGVHLGRDVFFEAVAVPDMDLVVIEEHAVVEQQVLLSAHSYEAPFITRERVHIGRHCTLRPTATTLPGFSMDDRSELGCLQVGLKGMVVERRDSLD